MCVESVRKPAWWEAFCNHAGFYTPAVTNLRLHTPDSFRSLGLERGTKKPLACGYVFQDTKHDLEIRLALKQESAMFLLDHK